MNIAIVVIHREYVDRLLPFARRQVKYINGISYVICEKVSQGSTHTCLSFHGMESVYSIPDIWIEQYAGARSEVAGFCIEDQLFCGPDDTQ